MMKRQEHGKSLLPDRGYNQSSKLADGLKQP